MVQYKGCVNKYTIGANQQWPNESMHIQRMNQPHPHIDVYKKLEEMKLNVKSYTA